MPRFTPFFFLLHRTALAAALAFILLPLVLAAEEKKDEYLISAQALENDEAAQRIKASGAVQIDGPDQKVLADEVLFDKKNDTVEARGRVAVVEKDGTVMFAEKTEMSSGMRDGYAKNVGLLLPDNSRMAARDARRAEGRYTVFSKGKYSPCTLCKDNPRKAPLWQLKAERTTHDAETKDLIYRDATLEMFGVPMFYTPYFTHPDPTVKRRQGLLTPSYGRNPDIGHFVRMPYYFDIAPDVDYTFTPTFNGEDGMQWAGTLRKRFEKGNLEFTHSMVIADRTDDDGITKKDQFRGHLYGVGRYDIDNIFRTGTQFAVLTDKNYLRRYSQSGEDVLENRVFVEGFTGRGYGVADFFYFQDNRPGARPEQPLVLPRLRFITYGEPDAMLGGRWSLGGRFVSLARDAEASTQKLEMTAGWERRDVLPAGLVSTLRANVRDNIYYVDNLQDPTTPARRFQGDASHRLTPEGQAMLSLPLAQDFGSFSHIIEPIVALSASPTVDYNPRIPNEDSIDVEFDTTNLFDINRYPGTDGVEQGTRATYGLKNSFYGTGGSYAEFMFGQNYRLTPDPQYPVGSGLETELSDYVGQVKMVPGNWASLDYFFRLDKDGTSFRKHDLVTNFGIPELRPRFRYTSINPPAVVPPGVGQVEEMSYGFTSQFAEFWSFSADQTRDLRPAFEGLRTTVLRLTYADECFRTSIGFVRDHTVRTGVRTGDTVLFQIYFKNLGGIDGGNS